MDLSKPVELSVPVVKKLLRSDVSILFQRLLLLREDVGVFFPFLGLEQEGGHIQDAIKVTVICEDEEPHREYYMRFQVWNPLTTKPIYVLNKGWLRFCKGLGLKVNDVITLNMFRNPSNSEPCMLFSVDRANIDDAQIQEHLIER